MGVRVTVPDLDRDPTVEAIGGLDSSAGVVVQTGADAFTKRSIAVSGSNISVANGSGASGNPTISLASVLQNTTASFTTADETKLDGIEALADVTDAANVAAAGALMTGSTGTLGAGWLSWLTGALTSVISTFMQSALVVTTAHAFAKIVDGTLTLENYAALTALTSPAANVTYRVHGHTTRGDGGGGDFYCLPADTTTADGGLILAVDGGGAGRFFRIHNGVGHIEWWGGAVGDGVANATAAIRLAAASGLVIEPPSPGRIYLMHTEGVSADHWANGTLFRRVHFRAKTGSGAFNSKYVGTAYRSLITQNMFVLNEYDDGGGFEDCTFDTDGAAEVAVSVIRITGGCDTKPFVMKGVNTFSGFTGHVAVATAQEIGKAGFHADTLQFKNVGGTRSVTEGYWLDGSFAQVTCLALDGDLTTHGSYNVHIKTVILDNIFSTGQHFTEGPQVDGVTIACPTDLTKLADRRIRIDRILARDVVGEVYDSHGTGASIGEVYADNCMIPGKHTHGSDTEVSKIIARSCGFLSLAASSTTALPTKPKIDYRAKESGYIIRSGTAQAGGAATITLDSGASTIDDYYVPNGGARVWITGGTGSGQDREISSYVGSTKVLTVSSTWGVNPDNTSTFVITFSNNAAAVVIFADDGSGTYVGPMSGLELDMDVEDSDYITYKLYSAMSATTRYNLVRVVEPRGRTKAVASLTSSIQIVHAGYPNGLELYRNTAHLTHTGDTSLTTLATITIPANAMGRNGEVIIEGLVTWTENANSKLFRVNFSGTNIMEVFGTTGVLEHVPFRLRVRNLNSLAVQRSSNVAYPFTVSSNTPRSLTAATSGDVSITIPVQLGDAADSITVMDLSVRVIHAP